MHQFVRLLLETKQRIFWNQCSIILRIEHSLSIILAFFRIFRASLWHLFGRELLGTQNASFNSIIRKRLLLLPLQMLNACCHSLCRPTKRLQIVFLYSQVQRMDNNTQHIYSRSHKGTGCNDPSTSRCNQWHLRRDAATIQRNTCELRYLKQHNIKNLFIKLTWTLRTCHFSP